MSKLMWFAFFGVVYVTAAMAANETSSITEESNTNFTHFELFEFTVGDFQGMLFGDESFAHADNNSIGLLSANESMFMPSDLMTGDIMMVYRNTKLTTSPAQNVTVASYKVSRTRSGKDCQGIDISLDLVSIIKLTGHAEVCTESNGYWSLAANPCVSVFGFDLGCTEIKLSSDHVKYCWNVNVALAKAELCAEVQKNCLGFNGEGCYYSFPGWSCKNFDAQAFCW